jgi:hypothetical protein
MWWRRKARQAEILDEGTRTVVVHFPGRQYPAVAVQGDTLWTWRHRIDRIAARAEQLQDDQLSREARGLQELIHIVFDDYNQACKRHGRGGFQGSE